LDATGDDASEIDANPGDDADPSTDAADDGADDAGDDGAADARVDASPQDAGHDTGADTGVDAGHDSGIDAGADTGTDAGHDSGTDAGHDSGSVCGGLAEWYAGTTDSHVKHFGEKYTCKVSGWCSDGTPNAVAYYEPGKGLAWTQAWDDDGVCP